MLISNLKWGFILNICVFSFANSIPRWMHHIWLYVVFWLSWCWPMLLITARLTQLIFGDHIITPVPARQLWRRSMNISSWFNRKGQNNHNNTKHNISMCIFHGHSVFNELHWCFVSLSIVPVAVRQLWWTWINISNQPTGNWQYYHNIAMHSITMFALNSPYHI